jgi:hypothetical protein
MKRAFHLVVTVLGAATALLPPLAAAEPAGADDGWQYGALVYLYFPDIGGRVDFPIGGSAGIAVDARDVYSNLQFGVLGSFEARRGDYGLFTDLIYMDAGAFHSSFRDLTIGRVALPADVSASVNFDLKNTFWTLAGTYRLVRTTDAALDLVAGVRYASVKEQVSWTLNGNVGQFPLPERAGTQSVTDHVWDGIVGIKGRLAFGPDLRWFVPYYGDIGTGNSDVTWQAMAGLGYAFKWGELVGGWRYLDYQFKSSSAIDSLNLNGPLIGVSLHW